MSVNTIAGVHAVHWQECQHIRLFEWGNHAEAGKRAYLGASIHAGPERIVPDTDDSPAPDGEPCPSRVISCLLRRSVEGGVT